MKKLLCALLCLLMIGMMSVAMAEKPGDTITLTLSITSTNGGSAGKVHFNASGAPVTCTSVAANNQTSNMMVIPSGASLNGAVSVVGYMDHATQTQYVVEGVVGTATFTINSDAKPGTYTISVYGSGAVTGASGSKTFTIKCTDHVSDSGTVTKKATCKETGTKVYKCTACGETIKTETLAVLSHDMKTVKTTKAATCTEDGTKTYSCSMCNEVQKTETIPATGHGTLTEKVTKPATCTEPGEKTFTCPNCNVVQKTEAIPATGHSDGETKVTKAATCTEKGEKTTYCAVCKAAIKTADVDPLGHQEGTAKETKAPTCTEKGEKTTSCTVCKEVLKTEDIPAKGHSKGNATVSKQPTCTETGLRSYKCTVCKAEVENEEIPANGHKEDKGTVTTKPTCTEKGVKTFKCSTCGEVLREEVVAANGHKEDKGTITLEPTCTEAGEKTFKCSVCGVELRTATVAAKGHKSGKWVVIKPATKEEEGERELHCAVCDVVIRTEIIPSNVYLHMNVCSEGIRFRDLDEDLSKEWFMFTPVDLSVDGEYTFNLIAGNTHVIGTVTMTVFEGAVTITYELVNPHFIQLVEEFMTILPSLEAVEVVDVEEMTNYPFGEPISIQEDLGGDTKVLLFIRNKVIYRDDTVGIKEFDFNGDEYFAYTEELKLLMD